MWLFICDKLMMIDVVSHAVLLFSTTVPKTYLQIKVLVKLKN